jgi:hypothetical protein
MNLNGLPFRMRVLLVWALLTCLETVHAIWRERYLALWLSPFLARQVCVFTGSLLILMITYACIPYIRAKNKKDLFAAGSVWLGLTIAFQFVLGRYLFHRSWADLSSDFNILRGGMLPVGLVIVTFAPLIAARLRGFTSESHEELGGGSPRISLPDAHH